MKNNENVLFHGTSEEIEGGLRGGGYDKILWTAEDASTAQSYIPVSSYVAFSIDNFTLKHAIRPESSFDETLLTQMGYGFKVEKDNYGRPRSFWYYDKEGNTVKPPTFAMALEFLEDLGYKTKETGGRGFLKIKTSFQNGKEEILPADYSREGHLYMMYGDRSNLNIFDYAEGKEGDLTESHKKSPSFRWGMNCDLGKTNLKTSYNLEEFIAFSKNIIL